jgi:hypothetical protein
MTCLNTRRQAALHLELRVSWDTAPRSVAGVDRRFICAYRLIIRAIKSQTALYFLGTYSKNERE